MNTINAIIDVANNDENINDENERLLIKHIASHIFNFILTKYVTEYMKSNKIRKLIREYVIKNRDYIISGISELDITVIDVENDSFENILANVIRCIVYKLSDSYTELLNMINFN